MTVITLTGRATVSLALTQKELGHAILEHVCDLVGLDTEPSRGEALCSTWKIERGPKSNPEKPKVVIVNPGKNEKYLVTRNPRVVTLVKAANLLMHKEIK